ncbi:hypothetical protein GS399_00870 [Pedobacter sp. HMF7647]|uniref:Uncharacterized protein n=1 Tax=Hufsiella arboris TaxID=2695275 RepID=A0A7K1Y653_9SPHI|nr:hypothetical protein [Hufsiella arboris]MXV49508.1 hypothetical protein [Hufsiella arboris]
MNFLKPLLLHKKVNIFIPAEKVKNKLNHYSQTEFTIRKINDDDYKFISVLSVGTARINMFNIEGINVNAKIEPVDKNKTNVILQTKLRIELIIIALLGIIWLLAHFIGNTEMPAWGIIFYLIVLGWFGYIYRVQEEILLKDAERFFKAL